MTFKGPPNPNYSIIKGHSYYWGSVGCRPRDHVFSEAAFFRAKEKTPVEICKHIPHTTTAAAVLKCCLESNANVKLQLPSN